MEVGVKRCIKSREHIYQFEDSYNVSKDVGGGCKLTELKWLVPEATFRPEYDNEVYAIKTLKGFSVRKGSP